MVTAQTQTGVVSPIYVQMKDSADSLAGLSPQQQRKITRMSHMRLKKIYEKILIVRKIEKVEQKEPEKPPHLVRISRGSLQR